MLPEAAFSRPRSQFFTIRTDPKSVNNVYIFSCFFSPNLIYLVKKPCRDCLAKCVCIIHANPMLGRSLSYGKSG